MGKHPLSLMDRRDEGQESWESVGREPEEDDLAMSWVEEGEEDENAGFVIRETIADSTREEQGRTNREEGRYSTETSSSSVSTSDGEEEGRGGANPIGVGIGAALLLGATLGLGVGVGVAALATVASRQIQSQAPSFFDKLGLGPDKFNKRKPLKAEKWCECCDAEGRVANFQELLKDISKGGICETIRVTVWPFLLGLVDANSTAEERTSQYEEYRARYASLVDQCKRMQRDLLENADGVAEFSKPELEYKENRRILNLDVVRTDFSSMTLVQLDSALEEDAVALGVSDHIERAEYLSLEQKQYAKYMAKLLLCYSIHDPPTGYCQGMTDLIQPFAQIFQEEAMSFWSFDSFMKSARENFMTDESGIMKRIGLLKLVIVEVAPDLFQTFDDIGAGSFFFAYRMILVFLRRELTIDVSILFWEILWVEDLLKEKEVGNDVPEFLVFAIAALILEREQEITTSCRAESDVVHMFCNLQINVWHMVERARQLRTTWKAGACQIE